MEAGQAPWRLPRRLRWRLLLGPASADRPATVGPRRREQARAVPRLHLDRHPSPRASGPAPDARRPLAARESPLPHADARMVSGARRGGDAARAHAASSRPALDHLLPRPRIGRQEVTRMDLTHQLAPMLRTLRLSGILETLDVRNRQAVEQQSSFVEFLTLLLQDEV